MSDPLPGLAGHDAAALFDDAAYAEMPALLGRAQHTIRMAFYLFGGPLADRMMDILASQQAQGVAVRVLLDRSLGRRNFLPGIMADGWRAYRRLRALGVAVRLSDPRPLPDWPRKPPQMHRKFMVVDDREALVGGMNVGTLFGRYHDLMLHLRGPIARSLAELFDDEWRLAGGDSPRPSGPAPLDRADEEDTATPGQTRARLLGTGRGQFPTETALRQNLTHARSSVCVALCEMGRTDLVDEMIACRGRGVTVRVLLDPLVSYPWLPPAPLNTGAVDALRRAGVPIHFYRLGPDVLRLHLKLALFDGERAVAGSTNWTRAGFGWVRETDVELSGGSVISQLQTQFETDWHRSAPAPPPSRLALRQYALYERWAQSS
jgi:phosphatidylserine/phosphatidylglycerophosphate/cardiolipin synthase-like enzyme